MVCVSVSVCECVCGRILGQPRVPILNNALKLRKQGFCLANQTLLSDQMVEMAQQP